MGASQDFSVPDFSNPLDADLDQIRDNYHFLLMIAASGSIVIPGYRVTVTATDYSEPETITLTKGTQRFLFHYTWNADGSVASIQMCYDDGVSSPGLSCFDAIEFTYDSEGNLSAVGYKTEAKTLGSPVYTSVSNYYSSTQGLINLDYQKMTLVFSFYGDGYRGISSYPVFDTTNGVFRTGYYSSSGGWQFDLRNTGFTTRTLSYTTTPGAISTGAWHAVMFAIDATADTAKLWVDGTVVQTFSGFSGDTFEAHDSYGSQFLGKNISTAGGQDGGISHVWCDDVYLDPATNWSLFFDASYKPISLGADGSTPTGTQPLSCFLDGNAVNNVGTLNNWTEVGTVPDEPTSPTD